MSDKICITRDIEGVERVEKLVSLNPDRYEWKDFYIMLDAYREYCFLAANSEIMKYTEPGQLKTFKEWLDTEI